MLYLLMPRVNINKRGVYIGSREHLIYVSLLSILQLFIYLNVSYYLLKLFYLSFRYRQNILTENNFKNKYERS